EIATILSGTLTVGMSSHATYKPATRILRSLGVEVVRVALDADSRTNPEVARSVGGAVAYLREHGFTVELELWDVADGKGIDDLLADGKVPDVVSGEMIDRAIATITESATRAVRAKAEVKLAGSAEADDDPHRLALIYLDDYRLPNGRLILRSWQKEFYQYAE